MRALAVVVLLLATPGCLGVEGSWTFTPDRGEPIRVEGVEYDVELDLAGGNWTATRTGAARGKATYGFVWSGVPGVGVDVGPLVCDPDATGTAGEGPGYAWSIGPTPEGCRLQYVSTVRVQANTLSWRAGGWNATSDTMRATLAVEKHP